MSDVHVLIDGSNFMFRCLWSQKLTANGERVEVLFACFRNTIALIKDIEKLEPGDTIIPTFCWDRGYKKRTAISIEAIGNGLIDKSYKQDRRENRAAEEAIKDEEDKVEDKIKHDQIKKFEEMLNLTSIRQIHKDGEEADDVIGTLAHKYGLLGDKVYIVSSDRDYYQLITEKVKIYNSHKKYVVDLARFEDEFGLDNPDQWIDVGAMEGDSGDTIVGVPGWGPATALKYIGEYKNVETLLSELKKKGQYLFDEYVDAKGIEAACFEDEYDEKKDATYRKLKKGIKWPWKSCEWNAIQHESRIHVAKKLKAIFIDLDLPDLGLLTSDANALEMAFEELSFRSLLRDVHYVINQPAPDNVMDLINIVKGGMKSKIHKCKSCGAESMSSGDIEECPECSAEIEDGDTTEAGKAKMYQPELF